MQRRSARRARANPVPERRLDSISEIADALAENLFAPPWRTPAKIALYQRAVRGVRSEIVPRPAPSKTQLPELLVGLARRTSTKRPAKVRKEEAEQLLSGALEVLFTRELVPETWADGSAFRSVHVVEGGPKTLAPSEVAAIAADWQGIERCFALAGEARRRFVDAATWIVAQPVLYSEEAKAHVAGGWRSAGRFAFGGNTPPILSVFRQRPAAIAAGTWAAGYGVNAIRVVESESVVASIANDKTRHEGLLFATQAEFKRAMVPRARYYASNLNAESLVSLAFTWPWPDVPNPWEPLVEALVWGYAIYFAPDAMLLSIALPEKSESRRGPR